MTDRTRLPNPDWSSAEKSYAISRTADVVPFVRVAGLVEIPLDDQEVDETLLVFLRQRQIEFALIDRLGQQLAGVADHVGLHFAQADALACQRSDALALVVEVRGLGFVDEDLKRDVELLAVLEDAGVEVGDAPRSRVEVHAFVEGADLALAADFRVFRALAHGPRDATDPFARFEHAHVVSEFA